MGLFDNGYNPMRWDCEKDGCFNIKKRPKIEMFADCFPGRINFGDVDGIVEINGKGLMLEWKEQVGIGLPTGQRIMYERLTGGGLLTALIVIGNPQSMECKKYCFFYCGKQSGWKDANLNEIKLKIKNWVLWARKPITGAEDD
jgi:hypothetical protein